MMAGWGKIAEVVAVDKKMMDQTGNVVEVVVVVESDMMNYSPWPFLLLLLLFPETGFVVVVIVALLDSVVAGVVVVVDGFPFLYFSN